MNELIESIFDNFTVENVEIPVEFMRYKGHNTTYITYMEHSINDTYYSDNKLTHYMDLYDFDVFSKGNYLNIIKSMKEILEQNGFEWQASMSSMDMYEDDTGYYHKTLCFAYIRSADDDNIQSA